MKAVLITLVILTIASAATLKSCACSQFTLQAPCQAQFCLWNANTCSDLTTNCTLATTVSTCIAGGCYWNTTATTPVCADKPACAKITADAQTCTGYKCTLTGTAATGPCSDVSSCSSLKTEATCQFARATSSNDDSVCLWNSAATPAPGACIQASGCSDLVTQSLCDSIGGICTFSSNKCSDTDCTTLKDQPSCLSQICQWNAATTASGTSTCAPKDCTSTQFNTAPTCDTAGCFWNGSTCKFCDSSAQLISIAAILIAALVF